MARLRTALVVLAGLVLVAPSAGASGGDAARLRALLTDSGVPLNRAKTPTVASFPAAWAAFQRFAQAGDGENANLLFEFGVFESHYWGTSFEVVLISGQVHLVVHFPVAAYVAITRNLRATPCMPSAGCVFDCFFTGDDGLVPHPCRVAPGGYRVGDMRLSGRRSPSWVASVESSPVFQALLARHVRPVGYEVWQE